MALTNLQLIVARISRVEDAFVKGNPAFSEEAWAEKFWKDLTELVVAGLRELASHDGVEIEHLAAEKSGTAPVVIVSKPMLTGRQSKAVSFGPKLADKLNACRKDHWPGHEDQFLQEAKPEDTRCIRSLRMVRNLLANAALDQSNASPKEVLDPITPAEMAAFASPGGLLSELGRKGGEPAPEQ